jgi:hypothetical protein
MTHPNESGWTVGVDLATGKDETVATFEATLVQWEFDHQRRVHVLRLLDRELGAVLLVLADLADVSEGALTGALHYGKPVAFVTVRRGDTWWLRSMRPIKRTGPEAGASPDPDPTGALTAPVEVKRTKVTGDRIETVSVRMGAPFSGEVEALTAEEIGKRYGKEMGAVASQKVTIIPLGPGLTLIEREPDPVAPFRALLEAAVLPALCEAWKARNPYATVTVDPSRDWAVVTLGLGPWQGTTRLWWQRRERPLGERAEDLLECCWAEAADALARGWRLGR